MTRGVLAVIPARYGASRFPGKPLATLWGKPMIQHVWERARAIDGLDALVLATDDERIAAVARGFGAEVEMTSPDCASGTDRVAEVARRRNEAIVVNLQGDEPELDAAAVARMIGGMRADPTIRMATLAHGESDPAVLASEHVVKVGLDGDGFALYFSRRMPSTEAPTPVETRDASSTASPGRIGSSKVLRHIGVYGFTREFLLEFASWPPGAQERVERLEQLRALERGIRIRVFPSERPATGVDTPAELAALERRGPARA